MIASPQMCVPSGDGANGPKFTGKMDLAKELLLLVVAEQVNAVQVRIVRRGYLTVRNWDTAMEADYPLTKLSLKSL